MGTINSVAAECRIWSDYGLSNIAAFEKFEWLLKLVAHGRIATRFVQLSKFCLLINIGLQPAN